MKRMILDGWRRRFATERFSGKGGFYVQWQDVREFGESLSAYPIPSDAPLVAAWGYNMHESDDLVIRIQIAPANATGDLRVSVELADDFETSDRVRVAFLTNYQELDAFKVGIAEMMDRKAEEAVLAGR